MPQSNRAVLFVGLGALFSALACADRGKPQGGHAVRPQTASAAARAKAQELSARPKVAVSAPAPLGDAPRLSVNALINPGQNEWTRCYQGFVGGTDSKRDVMRLLTMCGPSTGMHDQGPHYSGALPPGADATVRVQLNKECVRLVAAAAGTVEDLELEVLPPGDGPSLALVSFGHNWAVLPKDKPLCVAKQGVYRVRLRSHSGAGPYDFRVLQYWP
jgi:hypothetical protein